MNFTQRIIGTLVFFETEEVRVPYYILQRNETINLHEIEYQLNADD